MMLDRRKGKRRITLGADKASDASPVIGDLRARNVTPHIAANATVSKPGKARKTVIGKRNLHHPGYAISLRCRKRIEEVFGRIKAHSGYDRVKVRGKQRVSAAFTFAVAAYNLIRLPKLLTPNCAPPPPA